MSRLALIFTLSLLALSPFASADIPHLISLQGRLTDATDNPISSSTNFVFRIFPSETGGTALWAEFQTLSPDTLGIFSALLGSVTALNIPFNESYWLEVQVQSGTGPTQILSPRTRMGSAGYALRSESPWNTTGNNIHTTNAGNVGIGTSSPAQKLAVSGDVSWTGTLQGGNVPWARLSNIPNYAGSSIPGGPATTATALASNGANCGAGQYAQGVDAGGNAEGCSAPAGGVTGSGTANYIPKWTAGTALGNSVIYDNGNVGIGTASPSPGAKLDVQGGQIRFKGINMEYVTGSNPTCPAGTGGIVIRKWSQPSCTVYCSCNLFMGWSVETPSCQASTTMNWGTCNPNALGTCYSSTWSEAICMGN